MFFFWLSTFWMLSVTNFWLLSLFDKFSTDYFSKFLVFLSLLTCIFCLHVIPQNFINITSCFFTLILCMFCFFSSSWFFFFLFFELSLFPILLYLLLGGSEPERFSAVIYFVVYSVFASFPFFFVLSGYYFFHYDFSMLFQNYYFSNLEKFYEHHFLVAELFWWIVPFIMKLPFFGFHMWILKVHVEAPVVGSIMLASVLLKLAIIGFYRMKSIFFWMSKLNFIYFWFLFVSVFVSLLIFRVEDLKILMAYSSVAHMSMGVSGILFSSYCSQLGGLIFSLAHGFVSSNLFLGVWTFYRSQSSRKVFVKSKKLLIFPFSVFLWFLVCCGNASVPPFLSFFSEFFIVYHLVSVNFLVFLFLLSVFFGGVFKILLYLYISHSSYSKLSSINSFHSGNLFLVFFLKVFFSLVVVFYFSLW